MAIFKKKLIQSPIMALFKTQATGTPITSVWPDLAKFRQV